MAAIPMLVVSLPPGLAGPQLYLQAVLAHPVFRAEFATRCWWTADIYRGLAGKWRLWRDARRWLRDSQPRLVYVVADLSLTFWLGLTFRLAGAPALVFHSHGARYHSPSNPLLRWLFSTALRHWARSRLAVGPDAAVAMYGTLDEVVQVPGLIDFHALRAGFSAPSCRQTGPLRIGCVGRLSAEKNQALLLRALAALGPAGRGAELWFVGRGGDRAALDALTDQLGLRDRVRFLGETAEMVAVYAELDALAVPSLWEGQCRVVAEAQSLGLPVLVSPVIPDFACLPEPPVRRVASYEVADWAAALAALVADPPARVWPALGPINAQLIALESGVLRLCAALRRAAA